MALTLLAVLVPTPASTAGSRIEGVDYTRIQENTLLKLSVTVEIGGRTFDNARLVNGNLLTREETDGIIRGVMLEMEINSGVLDFSRDIIAKAARVKGFNSEVLLELGLKLTGGDTLADIYKVAAGEMKAGDALQGYAIGKTVSTVCEKLMGGIAGTVVSGLYSCQDLAVQETARLIEESEIKQLALERVFLLNLFYSTCNARIRAAQLEKGTDGWKLQCAQTVWTKTSVFGVSALQYWRLDMDLEQDYVYGEDVTGNWSGRYRGSVRVQIWHDLSQLDESFLYSVALGETLPIRQTLTVLEYRDRYTMSSSLTKTLYREDFELHIDRKNAVSGSLAQPFSRKGFSDASLFCLYHPVFGKMRSGLWDANGHLEINAGPVHLKDNTSIQYNFSGSMTGDNKGVVLEVASWELTNNEWLRVPYKTFSYNLNEEQDGGDVLTDYGVYEDLRDGGGFVNIFGLGGQGK